MTKRITEIEAFTVTYSRGPVQKIRRSLTRYQKKTILSKMSCHDHWDPLQVSRLFRYILPNTNMYIYCDSFVDQTLSYRVYRHFKGNCGIAKSVSPGALSTPSFLCVSRIESISSSVISLRVWWSCVDHRHDSTSWAIEFIVSITRYCLQFDYVESLTGFAARRADTIVESIETWRLNTSRLGTRLDSWTRLHSTTRGTYVS